MRQDYQVLVYDPVHPVGSCLEPNQTFETAVALMRVDHSLKSWVGAKRIKHWIKPEQRRGDW